MTQSIHQEAPTVQPDASRWLGFAAYVIYWFSGILYGTFNPDAIDQLTMDNPAQDVMLSAIFWAFVLPLGFVYVCRGFSKDELVKIHTRWIARTYWFSCLWFVCAAAMTIIAAGMLATDNVLASALLFEGAGFTLLGMFIWGAYRMIRGIIALARNRPPKKGYGS